MSDPKRDRLVGALGQGGVRAIRKVVNDDLEASVEDRPEPVEPPGRDENALVGFVQRYLHRAIPDPDQRREFVKSVRHLQSERPDIAKSIVDMVRVGILEREIRDITVCLGDEYGFDEDGDGYRLDLPKNDPDAYCRDEDTPDF